ncbi:type VI secretion protein [Streptomyces sedi]|uniref:Type VI secretion protein n=1 Tax=Streptomyces sedi TaxID=555059 RepID=A0A5C4UNA9_9ACTN|nr:type VI secretion protein [Streptomyces sedi]TNM25120.1 type VI secretion protein [Streptomyces sedi]
MSQHHQPLGPTGPSRRGGGISDTLLVGLLGVTLALAVLTWTATGLGGWLRHGSWPEGVTFLNVGRALRGLLTDPGDIPGAWADAPPEALPSATLVWGTFLLQLVVLFSLALFVSIRVTTWRARRAARRIADELPPEPEPHAPFETAPVDPVPSPPAPAVPVHQTAPPPPRADPVGEVLDAPGGLVVVDPDGSLWTRTAKQRGRRGPLHVYDPGHLTEAPVRLRWAPHRGCERMPTARRRAERLLAPVRPAEPIFQLDAETAETLLRCCLHAAALAGEPFQHIPRWAQGRSLGEPGRVLRTHPQAAGGAVMELESALTAHPGRRDAALKLIGDALRPLEQVHIRQSCSPGRVDALALDNLTHETGTLYVVGDARETAGLRGALLDAVAETQPELAVVGEAPSAQGRR